MSRQVCPPHELLFAAWNLAFVRHTAIRLVRLHVRFQVVAALEELAADVARAVGILWTSKASLSSVVVFKLFCVSR